MKPEAMHWIGSILLATGFLCAPWSGLASDHTADLCDDAAVIAAERTGVPVDILRAIARVETGQLRNGIRAPWPWTINVAGRGQWFSSPEEAIRSVGDALKTGETRIDVGCFQVNIHWHANAFRSVEDMIDPVRNAEYAAGFLRLLFQDAQSWPAAIGAYHSRRPQNAEVYVAKVREELALGEARPSFSDPPTQRANSFPLLRRGTGGVRGSLFSKDARATAAPLLR